MKILSCVFVIIGIIIGAGFASGKEIYTFFFIYGPKGIIGLVVSSAILGYIIYKSLKIIKKYDINSYDELLKKIIIKKQRKNIDIELILNFIINLFLLITFFIMCAGFTAYFKQEFQIDEIYSSIAIAIISYIILSKNIKGIFLLNSILMPLIIIILTVLGIKSIGIAGNFEPVINNNMWLPKAILYASYNSITLVSLLIPIKKYIKNKKDIVKIASISTIIIIILAMIIVLLLLKIDLDISKIELPAVYASGLFGKVYQYLYGIIILGAIMTTSISSAFGFLNNITKTEKKYKLINKIICIASIFISLFGFSNLVNNIYPIFGVLGLVQLILIIKCK